MIGTFPMQYITTLEYEISSEFSDTSFSLEVCVILVYWFSFKAHLHFKTLYEENVKEMSYLVIMCLLLHTTQISLHSFLKRM